MLRPTARLARERGDDPNLWTIGIEFEDGGDPLGVDRTDAQYARGAELIADDRGALGDRARPRPRCRPPRGLRRQGVPRKPRRRAAARSRPPSARSGGDHLPAAGPQRRGRPARLPRVGVAFAAGGDRARRRLRRRDSRRCSRRARWSSGCSRNPRRADYARLGRRRQPPTPARCGDRGRRRLGDLPRRRRADRRGRRRGAARVRRQRRAPGCAYGFELYRAWGDEVAPTPMRVHRLFAPRPGQTLPDPPPRLHPGADPDPERRMDRDDDLGSGTSTRPSGSPTRHRKYEEADPGGGLASGPARMLREPEGDARAVAAAARRVAGARRRRRLGRSVRAATTAGARSTRCSPACCPRATRPRTCPASSKSAEAARRRRDRPRRRLDRRDRGDPRAQPAGRAGAGEPAPRGLRAAGTTPPTAQRLLDAARRVRRPAGRSSSTPTSGSTPTTPRRCARFLESGADPERAYGLRVFRMIGDDAPLRPRRALGLPAVLADAPGSLPGAKLHLVPVPDSIPRTGWAKTTIRIKHLAGLSAERRRGALRQVRAGRSRARLAERLQPAARRGPGHAGVAAAASRTCRCWPTPPGSAARARPRGARP